MSDQTAQPFPFEPAPYHNQSLFSNYLLDNSLPFTPRWEKAEIDSADFGDWLRGHYAQEKDQLTDFITK